MESKDLSKPDNRIVTLTPKARLFIDLICQGVKVPEAYKQAGYKGKDNHAAYSLKNLLSLHIKQALEARGFSMEGIATEILNLAKIPMMPRDSVSLDEKIKILKLFASVLCKDSPKSIIAPKVTAFIVNRGSGTTVPIQNSNIVDVSNVTKDV